VLCRRRAADVVGEVVGDMHAKIFIATLRGAQVGRANFAGVSDRKRGLGSTSIVAIMACAARSLYCHVPDKKAIDHRHLHA
jgi:hypothetical protein